MVAGILSATVARGAGINYNGTSLQENNEFTRTECGTAFKDVLPEISGLACSRTTPGYLWTHGDENTGSNKKIIAINPNAQSKNDELVMTVNISGDPGRDDWEDIATGVYGNTNYVFVGAFGDNNLKFNDNYYIYYFEEPAISSGTQTVAVNYIRFGYPDNQPHNTETLMYDNVEQMFYIVDKVKSGICHLYKLPFSTTYGTGVQRLTEVCALGNGSKFNYCTGGDITPDGQWMAIKSKPYVLLWERQGSESLSQTAQRNPVQVMAYKEEEQGESLAWFNDSIFYTTSDSKSNTPIYKYVRAGESGSDTTSVDPTPVTVDSTLKAIHEVVLTNGYYAYINADETIIRGWYLAGEDVPTVSSYKVSDGATWTQNGNTVTITALDESTATYTMDIQPVTPVEFTANEIVFDGSESSWVKGAYGFDATKKWRFSKTDEDYSREIAGKTHVELFLPACDTLYLTPFSGTERDVRFYINGVEFGTKTKFVQAGLTLAVLQSAPFMLTIASAQSSGDGGVAAIRMARKEATAIEDVPTDNIPCTKILRDGLLLIERNGKLYNAQGAVVR
jgi:hypothetical protein